MQMQLQLHVVADTIITSLIAHASPCTVSDWKMTAQLDMASNHAGKLRWAYMPRKEPVHARGCKVRRITALVEQFLSAVQIESD
jgi:hypothetical protein